MLLVFIGSFLSLLPIIVPNNKTFTYYSSFQFNSKLVTTFVLGFIFFVIGYKITFKLLKYSKSKLILIQLNRLPEIIIVSLLLLLVLLINIRIYGGIPILRILTGQNISTINLAQRDSGFGTFGLQVVLLYTLIVFIQPLVYKILNKSADKTVKVMVIVCLFLIAFVSMYSGKRQYIFISLLSIVSYLYYFNMLNGSKKNISKKVKKIIFKYGMFGTGVFVSLGIIRSGLEFSIVNTFYPILNYLSLPFMNLSNIIKFHGVNNYKYSFKGFIDIITFGLPSIFRTGNNSLYDMPLIEPTSPSTVYGSVYWHFGLPGSIIYMFILGMAFGYIYKKLKSGNVKYIAIYSFSVWPLLTIFMYNHFLNMMYFMIPILIVSFVSFYRNLGKILK